MAPSALYSGLSEPCPLYIPHREYPRPAAKQWLSKALEKFSFGDSLLGRVADPWLPLTALEGYLVIGHKEPAQPLAGIPEGLCIQVRLRAKDYDRLKPTCAEAFAAGDPSGKPDLIQVWSDSVEALLGEQPARPKPTGKVAGRDRHVDPAADSRRRVAMHALQFIITHQLTARTSASGSAPEFLKEHPSIAWIIETMVSGDRIMPLDDIRPDAYAAGAVPEYVTNHFKSICYAKDEDGIHVILPAGTLRALFTSELTARAQTKSPCHISFGDPEGTKKFADNASVTVADTVEGGTPDERTDTSVLNCGDPELLKRKVEALIDARDVVRWVIGHGVASAASDCHIAPRDATTSIIRLRHNSKLRVRGTISAAMHRRVMSVVKLRCGLNQTELRLPLDGKFKILYGTREADIRVSTLPVQRYEGAESCAFRFLGRSSIPSLERIGLDPYQMTQIDWLSTRSHGIFLVTGPTSSGKSTTLRCMMKEIASEENCCLSVEDPVEVSLPWVNQVQVRSDIKLTFAEALRAFLRHDPNVIMVGEIRDPETAGITFQAAGTGHLAFTTLHTNSVADSINRLADLGIDRRTIAATVRGIAAQRLVRTLCSQCRERTAIPDHIRTYVEKYVERLSKALLPTEQLGCPHAAELIGRATAWLAANEMYRHGGCGACLDTGFENRQAVLELYLVGNEPEVIEMIARGDPAYQIQRYFTARGHLDIAGHALRLMVNHRTTFDEIHTHLPLL